MDTLGTQALWLAGALTALAAAAHLVCIAIGAPAFRLLGAGERMARAVEAGQLQPIVVTLAITGVLAGWAAYAFAGAGVIGVLPGSRWVLPAISLVFLARALGFPLLKARFPENSNTFWVVSSAICLAIGALYALGTAAVWSRL